MSCGSDGQISQGTGTGLAGADVPSTLFVKKAEGAAETYPRQKIVYKVTEYNKKRSEMNGEERSREIVVMPYLNSPTETVSVKTKVTRGNIRIKLGETHYNAINRLFENSPNSATMFRKFEKELFVNRTDAEADDIEYNYLEKELNLNIETDKEGIEKDGHKVFEHYERTIHEIWHNIDHLAGPDSDTFFPQEYKDELIEALRVDFLNKVEANVNAIIAGNATKEDEDKINELIGEGKDFLSFLDIIDAITMGNLGYGTHDKSGETANVDITHSSTGKDGGDKLNSILSLCHTTPAKELNLNAQWVPSNLI